MQKTNTPPSAAPIHPMPFVRLELVVMSIQDERLVILEGKREQAPYQGKWALPGGVLRIDLDKTLDDAVQRVAQERLGARMMAARFVQTREGYAQRAPRHRSFWFELGGRDGWSVPPRR